MGGTGRIEPYLRRWPNVRSWLQADLQPPEIDFRFTPESRRFHGLG
jgi:hypothetical protein